MTYTVDWILKQEVADLLDFDPDATNQDFHGGTTDPWAKLKSALNRAYTKLILEAQQEVPNELFKGVHSVIWPSGQETLELPALVAGSALLSVWDVTDNNTGYEIFIGGSSREAEVWWETSTKLRFGESGPGSERTWRVEYLMDAELLSDFAQEPRLVPYRHRYVLVWGTAIEARLSVDEDNIPSSWLREFHTCKDRYIMDLAKGRVRLGNHARILDTNFYGDY